MIKQVNSTTESQPEVTKHTNKQTNKKQKTRKHWIISVLKDNLEII